MSTMPVCQFYKYGFCKYGDWCRHQHNDTVCENNACETLKCPFRHPRPCRFYKQYGRCKFGNYCQYSHVKFVDLEYKNILEKLMDKLNEMVDQKLTKVFNSLQDEISKFGKIAMHMERNLRNFKSDHAPQIVPTPHHIQTPTAGNGSSTSSIAISTPVRSDVARSTCSVSLLQPQPFQTVPGSSCCDHICRPDLEEDPQYEFCCRHRCRKPWT